jgi:hypothetical protein
MPTSDDADELTGDAAGPGPLGHETRALPS